MNISHLISRSSGISFDIIRVGILEIVFKLSKISSPVTPSPLDNPFFKKPFS